MKAFLFIGVLLSAPAAYAAEEMQIALASPGAPHAPTDITRAARDPYIPLSPSQRREIVREFRALLSMAMRPYAYTGWEGREISDCVKSPAGGNCKKCEIAMGQTKADYIFAPNEGSCHLHGIDIRVESTDQGLQKDLKPAAERFVGSEGFFSIEELQTGDTNIRFIWHR